MLLFLMSMVEESDRGKVVELYRRYKKEMLKYARSKFRSKGRKNYRFDAEDAVQATFFKLIKYLPNIDFNRTEKEIKNYAFATLHNEIKKISEKKEISTINVEEIPEEKIYNIAEELEIRKNYQRVVDEISKMDEIYSITLMHVFVYEKSVKDVASLMGISPKTVYTRLARGREILLSSLKGVIYD